MLKGKSQLNGFLDAGSHLHGELHFEDTFRIDGRLTGKVRSDGDLFVGESGHVDGEVEVARLFVTGRVDGVLRVSGRLEIAPGGRVYGEIVTPCLIIEEGAFFEGQSKMVDREAERLPAKVAAMRRD